MADTIGPLNNIRRIDPALTGAPAQAQPAGAAGQFQKILAEKLQPAVKFSAHALERLQKRNIVLSQESLDKLNRAVQKAEEKGSRESLVLMDDLALIVSVKNHTVITAIDGQRIKENVFTNIDSAVIV